MRLRQIALASTHLDDVTSALETVFGVKIAFRDPGVAHYGLRNAVMPTGKSFIEVVEPIKENTSAGRFLEKMKGDAGYMIILQTADAKAETARVRADGIRVVDEIDRKDYYCAHFHPADFGGMLTSFDQQKSVDDYRDDYGDWMPAGGKWQASKTDTVSDLKSVTLSNPDADMLAKRWSALLNLPLTGGNTIKLADGEIHFAKAPEGARTSISAIELKVKDVAAAEDRARKAGLKVEKDGIAIGGVHFKPVAA